MNLQDFISETLVQINTGVENARTRLGKEGVIINPYLKERWFGKPVDNPDFIGLTKDDGIAQTINFDISVTVENSSGLKGELKVATFIPIGIGGDKKQLEQNVSRISFCVPISFKVHKE